MDPTGQLRGEVRTPGPQASYAADQHYVIFYIYNVMKLL